MSIIFEVSNIVPTEASAKFLLYVLMFTVWMRSVGARRSRSAKTLTQLGLTTSSGAATSATISGAMVADAVRERRSKLRASEQRSQAGKASGQSRRVTQTPAARFCLCNQGIFETQRICNPPRKEAWLGATCIFSMLAAQLKSPMTAAPTGSSNPDRPLEEEIPR